MNEPSAVPYQNIINEQSTIDYNLQIESTSSIPLLKYRKTLNTLAIIQVIFAMLTVFLGIISFCFGVNNEHRGHGDGRFNFDLSGVWIGILYLVASAIGIGGFQNTTGHLGLIKAYFILVIVCTIFTPILIITSSIWMAVLGSMCNNAQKWWGESESFYCTFMGINAILFIISFVQSMYCILLDRKFLCLCKILFFLLQL